MQEEKDMIDPKNELQTVLEEVVDGIIAKCDKVKVQLDKSREIPDSDIHHALLYSYTDMLEVKGIMNKIIGYLQWNVANPNRINADVLPRPRSREAQSFKTQI